jgi:hypothetical protein
MASTGELGRVNVIVIPADKRGIGVTIEGVPAEVFLVPMNGDINVDQG